MLFFFFKILFIFLERGEGRDKEMERNINVWLPLTHPLLGTWPATQACGLTGNGTRDLSVCRPALNPLSLTCQGIHYVILMANICLWEVLNNTGFHS